MDKKLQIVKGLYESGSDGRAENPVGLDGQEELTREYQAMSQAKFWMDHRRGQRPDPGAIDAIVKAAATAAVTGDVPKGVRTDRAPLRLLRGTPFRAAVAAVVAIIAVSIGLWSTNDAPSTQEIVGKDKAEIAGNLNVPAPAERRARAGERLAEDEETPREQEPARAGLESATELDAVGAGRAFASSRMDSALLDDRLNAATGIVAASAASDVHEWDHPDELVQIQQRIEHLKTRQSDLGWDKPLVPLEMLPASAPADPGIRQAGAKGQ
ncbi:MAG: hypothetical protein KJO98_00465 [Rhodothermia bacterium]|nr:hypothetical protein [Rhodothermia bacterium]